MKRIILAIGMLAACVSAVAQNTSEEFVRRYNALVKNVGVDGVGVETLLDRWEKAFPDDVEMLTGRFNYYFTKSQSSQVIQKNADKFMGQKPMLALKDSLGNDVNYFQEYFYEDSLFAMASSAIDKAIRLEPANLNLRFNKFNSLMAYEKENPDMTTMAISGLIDYIGSNRNNGWKFNGEDADEDLIKAAIQEYCLSLYTIASPSAFESFRKLSERMLVWYKDDPMFLDNIGTYWLIARKDSKQALKWYTKVLKKNPDDYTAIKNCVLMARNDKNVKLEKKYLPALVRNAASDSERAQAQARLDALAKK